MAFKFQMKYTIERRLLPSGSKRRSGARINGPKFIVAHATGNPGSNAERNVTYYINSAYQEEASAHAFVDDKRIIECVPTNEKAWHVRYAVAKDNQLFGLDANDAALGIELCYGGTINNQEAYNRYVWYIAYLCYKYKIEPQSRVVGHYLLDPTRRSDPMDAFKYVGKTYAAFLVDLQREYDECTGKITAADKQVLGISDVLKEEDPKMAELYKPSYTDIKNSTENVLHGFTYAKEKQISGMWLNKLRRGELTNSDAIGLLYVGLDRGLLKIEKQ